MALRPRTSFFLSPARNCTSVHPKTARCSNHIERLLTENFDSREASRKISHVFSSVNWTLAEYSQAHVSQDMQTLHSHSCQYRHICYVCFTHHQAFTIQFYSWRISNKLHQGRTIAHASRIRRYWQFPASIRDKCRISA